MALQFDQNTLQTLLHPTQYAPIRQRIMSFLTTLDLVRLCQTSYTIRQYIKSTEWDINARLRRFFNDPVAFRTQLGRSDALISGSFALQFFARTLWPESDIDIMVQDGPLMEQLHDYLEQKESYEMTVSRKDWDYEDAMKNLVECRTYTRGDRKVQIIATNDIPIKSILEGYYTSAIMNVITWNKAYSVFPRSTLIEYQTVPTKPLTDYYGLLHQKYSIRGWRTRTYTPNAMVGLSSYDDKIRRKSTLKLRDEFNHRSHYADRRVGDEISWVMSLDKTGVTPGPTPDFVIEHACFSVEPLHEGSDMHYDLEDMDWESFGDSLSYTITASTFSSHVLRYRYTYGLWKSFERISRIMKHATLAQMFKLDNAKRDELVGQDHIGAAHIDTMGFDKPAGWDYLDDLVPLQLAQWWSETYPEKSSTDSK